MNGYRRGSWEDQVIGEGMAVIAILFILVVAAVVTLVLAAGKETARLAEESASYSDSTRKVLLWTLLSFLGLVLACGLFAVLIPAVTTGAVYTAAWSFLVCVLIVEGCDWRERGRERGSTSRLGDLDTYLDFESPTSVHLGSDSRNGKAEPLPIGNR